MKIIILIIIVVVAIFFFMGKKDDSSSAGGESEQDLRRRLVGVDKDPEKMSFDTQAEYGIHTQLQLISDICDKYGIEKEQEDAMISFLGMLYSIAINKRAKLIQRSRIYKNYLNAMRKGPDGDEIYPGPNVLYTEDLGHLYFHMWDELLIWDKSSSDPYYSYAESTLHNWNDQFKWGPEAIKSLRDQAKQSLNDFKKVPYPRDYDKYSSPADKSWLKTNNSETKNQWFCFTNEEILDLESELGLYVWTYAEKWLNVLTEDHPDDKTIENLVALMVPLVVMGTQILTKKNTLPDSIGFLREEFVIVDQSLKMKYPSAYQDGFDWEGLLGNIVDLNTEAGKPISVIEPDQSAVEFNDKDTIMHICTLMTIEMLGVLATHMDAYKECKNILEGYKEQIINMSDHYALNGEEKISVWSSLYHQ